MPKENSEKKRPKKMTYGEMLDHAAAVAANTAIQKYKDELEAHKRNVNDKKFRNTKLLLRQYRVLRDYAKNVVSETESIEELDIMSLISGISDSERYKAECVKNQVAFTKAIMQHVELMLGVYKAKCLSSGIPAMSRRWRVIESMYIEGDTAGDIYAISEKESIDTRTVYKDVDKACDELSNLIFGLDLSNFIV